METQAQESEAHPSFGSLLRKYRLARSLTQEALAAEAGLSRDAIALLERGARRSPRPDTVALLARALKLSADERTLLLSAAQPRGRGVTTGAPSSRLSPALPLRLTSFVGRESEIAEVRELLRARRLLTLTGPGGIGKTSLALEVASAAQRDFPDGVAFVELAGLADGELVPFAVASALDVRERQDKPIPQDKPILATLSRSVGEGQRLLVLDDCDLLLQGCAEVSRALLKACPKLKILATSREPLRVEAEVLWRVPPLTLPREGEQSLEKIAQSEAVRLFVERAKAAYSDFGLTRANAPSVAEICRRLDGIALAIELAAARVALLTPEQISRSLSDRFRLLTSSSRTALPRHQTLRALIDWSYDLLDEPERALLRRLSVFAGGCSLEAVERVCAGRGIATDEVLELLARLVDKSLVVVESGTGQESRYWLLDTIRQYARERLEEAGEAAEVNARHREWLVELAERAEPELTGPSSQEWLSRIEREEHNLRTALERSLEADPAMGLRLAGSLQHYWQARGSVTEGRRWLEALLAQGPPPRAEQAKDYATAAAGLQASLELFRELGDKRGIARSLLGLSWLTLRSVPSRASVMLEESLGLFRELGDDWGVGLALAYLSDIAGSRERAVALREEALVHSRLAGDWRGVASTLYVLGLLSQSGCDYERARTLFEESVSLLRKIGHGWSAGWALSGLGALAMGEGDYGRARALLEESLALGRELKDELGITWRLLYLGHLARLEGRCDEARSLLEECLTLSRTRGFNDYHSLSLVSLGSLARLEGRYGETETLYRAGLSSLRQMGALGYVPNCLQLWGALEVDQGRHARAVRMIAAGTASHSECNFLSPAAGADADVALAAARSALGEEAFAKAFAEGQAMTLEQAVDYALSARGCGRSSRCTGPARAW